MKSILALFFLLAVASSARIPRDTKENADPSTLETIMSTAQTNMQSFGDEIQKLMSKATEEMKAKNPEIEKLLINAKDSLQKVSDDFNAQFPNAKEQFNELQNKMKQAFTVVTQEAEKTIQNINTQLKAETPK